MNTCLDKQKQLIAFFKSCHTLDERYQKMIELGRTLAPLSAQFKTDFSRVTGCQSTVYLHAELKEGKIYFTASSEALISAGLIALLIAVYNGEAPETVVQCKPSFLTELDIHATLSPGRSNGLASMYLRMQQEALKFLVINRK